MPVIAFNNYNGYDSMAGQRAIHLGLDRRTGTEYVQCRYHYNNKGAHLHSAQLKVKCLANVATVSDATWMATDSELQTTALKTGQETKTNELAAALRGLRPPQNP